MPVTAKKRLLESGPYTYNFVNDPVISAGDPIASIVSVVSVIMTDGATVNLTIGTYTFQGTIVTIPISGGQENVQYEVTVVVSTVGGFNRVGIGYMVVNDEG